MEIIDNVNKTLRDDLQNEIKKGSKIDIIAEDASIYVFNELREKLQDISGVRFIFTTPKSLKRNKNFCMPYEQKFRNQLMQRAIAEECIEWIKEKVKFKVNTTSNQMLGFLNVDNKNYMPLNCMSMSELGCVKGNSEYTMIQKNESPFSEAYTQIFNQLWKDRHKTKYVTEEVIDNLSSLCKDITPEFMYYFILYQIFSNSNISTSNEMLIKEEVGIKDSQIWNKLYPFQKDAVTAIINKLEKYNGCILADSVGLGKTYTALAVIKYYELRNNSVLVLCPKKLSSNWNTYKDNYINNPISKDRLRYDVLYHTDLDRMNRGVSNGIDLQRFNWENYDLVVIDESHNFRNGEKVNKAGDSNRYSKLLNDVIKKGVKTKVLMLSATPVNTKFSDLKNQLALAYEGEEQQLDSKLDTKKKTNDIFLNAQKAFNRWSKLPQNRRTTVELTKMLDIDFFKLLDSVTIARSRKHIQKFYDLDDIGMFPNRLSPISVRTKLTNLEKCITYKEIFEQLNQLSLALYIPTHFILPEKIKKYAEKYKDNKVNIGFTQANREQGIRRIIAINLMKRIESSVSSFKLSLTRLEEQIDRILNIIERYEQQGAYSININEFGIEDEFDEEDDLSGYMIGKKIQIDIRDMNYLSWKEYLQEDRKILLELICQISKITPENDYKLQSVLKTIENKIESPINKGNNKIILFTAFSDTAKYLYDNISIYAKKNFNLETAMITGVLKDQSTIEGLDNNFNTILSHFSPISRDIQLQEKEIDILIATDCISEGQNLQDCDYLINYDIHWNPVRIIQRFGRIDRIGSKNKDIQLVNYWPDVSLDEYINLKSRVETRMKIVDLTATADDNLLNDSEKSDIEYRKTQLKRLQEEVVDLEDMSGQVSIMNLGLNEFKLELFAYMNQFPSIQETPYGLYTLSKTTEENPSGVIFFLKKTKDCNVLDKQNVLYPFYVIYVSDDKQIICDYRDVGESLSRIRTLCKGQNKIRAEECQRFSDETNHGREMSSIVGLLKFAIEKIIEVKEDSDIDSLFRPGGTSLLDNSFKDIDDFEVVSYIIVR